MRARARAGATAPRGAARGVTLEASGVRRPPPFWAEPRGGLARGTPRGGGGRRALRVSARVIFSVSRSAGQSRWGSAARASERGARRRRAREGGSTRAAGAARGGRPRARARRRGGGPEAPGFPPYPTPRARTRRRGRIFPRSGTARRQPSARAGAGRHGDARHGALASGGARGGGRVPRGPTRMGRPGRRGAAGRATSPPGSP